MKKLTLYIQMILSVLVIVTLIMFIVNKNNLTYVELALGATLLLMSYNNSKFYKRKGFSIYYLIFGIIMLVFALIRILGI